MLCKLVLKSMLTGMIGIFPTEIALGATPTSITFANAYTDSATISVGNVVLPTADGGYIVGGQRTYDTAAQDAWLAKLDSSGNLVWQQSYHGGYESGITAVRATSAGGYIVAGLSVATDASFSDIWVADLDANGNILWQKTYGGGDNDIAESVQETADGGFIVAGITKSFPVGTESLWILQLNGKGMVKSQQTFNTGVSNATSGFSMQPTSDGGYIAAGNLATRMWVIKLTPNATTGRKDPGFTVAWNVGYNNSLNVFSSANAVSQTTDGGYIVSGWVQIQNDNGLDQEYAVSVLKLDASGNITWQTTYGEGLSTLPSGLIRQTSDGGYVVLGSTQQVGANFVSVLVLKLDSSGAVTWQNQYNAPSGQGNAIGYWIEQTADSGYVVTGWISPEQVQTFAGSMMLLKTDSSGLIASCAAIQQPGTAAVGVSSDTPFSPTIIVTTTKATVARATAVASATTATSASMCP